MATPTPAHLEGISPAGIPLANPGDRHTRRDTDPLAHDLFYYGISHLPLPDRKLVLAALEAAEFNAHATPEVQIHRDAMRDCLRVHRKLTKPIWEAYRLEHDPHEEVLRPAGEVAEMLGAGNWTAAVEIIMNETVPDPIALRLTGVGDEPTEAELCGLLVECAGWLERNYFGPKDYREFEEAMDGVERDGPPLVKSYTFQRRFGTFALARKAAGLLTPDEPPPRGGDGDYQPDRALELFRSAHDEFEKVIVPRPGEVMTVAFFAEWRLAEAEDALIRGEVLVIPCATSYARWFGGWAGTFVEAGILTAYQSLSVPSDRRSGGRPKWYLAWSLLVSLLEAGDLSQTAWERWRDRHAARPGALRPAASATVEKALIRGALAAGRKPARKVLAAGGGIDELLAELGWDGDRPEHVANRPTPQPA